MKKELTEQLELIAKLSDSGHKFAEELVPSDESHLPSVFLYTTVIRATGILDSMHLLIQEEQIVSAEILARTFIETAININYLHILVQHEGEQAFGRILDAAVLQKHKLVTGIDWGSPYQENFEHWDEILASIRDHYSKEELKGIRKNGLFGCSLEERAQAIGKDNWYDSGYREYSKNVHGLDMHEVLAERNEDEPYLESRLDALVGIIPGLASAIFLACKEMKEFR